MRFASMKSKMTLVIFLLVVLLASLTALSFHLFFENTFKKTMVSQQFSLLQAIASQLDDKFSEAQNHLRRLADEVTSATLADPHSAQRALDSEQGHEPFFNNSLFLFSPAGTMIAASPKELNFVGKDFSFRDYFKQTVATGKPFISAPFASIQKNSRPLIMFTTPVLDDNKQLIAVLAGSVDLKDQHYLQMLSSIKLGKNGFLSLYDTNRTVLMHPNKGRVLKQDQPGENKLIDKALAGFEGTEETLSVIGIPVLRSVIRIKSTGWILAASYPLKEAYAPLAKARKYFLLGGGLAALISALLVWLAMKYMTAPLLAFTRHIELLPTMEGEQRFAPLQGRDEIGKLVQTFNWMLVELDEQKRKLKEQIEFQRTLMETIPNPIYYKDLKGRYLGCNSAFENMIGMARGELIGKLAAEITPQIHVERHGTPGSGQVLALGTQVREGAVITDNGEMHNVINYKTAFPNADGTPGGMIGLICDVSERTRAEENLRESEVRYRSLVDNVDLGIALIDRDFTVLMVNSAKIRLSGAGSPDVIGRHCFLSLENNSAACPDCPGLAAMAEGRPVTIERDDLLADGRRVVVRLRAFPLFNTAGFADKFIEITEDITEQRLAEEERQVLEQQLRQAQKMEAIGTLAGGIAHDFNNILTAIIAYCSLMQRNSPENDQVHHYLPKILAAADRAATLTKGLLTYSRKRHQNLATIDLNEIVRKVNGLLSRLLGEDIEFKTLPANEPLPVFADSLQIEQILMNLATNAKDAMPHGGILQISTQRQEIDRQFIKAHGYGKAGAYALIRVSDNGTGLDESDRERIFEPFYTTKEVGKGTGLGLSIVYGIIKQHHGYINVYSEPGDGTTFTIYLPLTEREGSSIIEAEPDHPNKGNETILVIEDDESIRETLREVLSSDGYQVIEAVDGEDGISKFLAHANDIQLLLLDVIMPRKNGPIVYQEIKALRPGIRALFVSGYTSDILKAKGVLQEDLEFIAKPFVVHELLTKIREVLDK